LPTSTSPQAGIIFFKYGIMKTMKKNDVQKPINRILKEALYKALREILQADDLTIDTIQLEHPADFSHGDFASNIALSLYKKYTSQLSVKNINSPLEFAEQIAERVHAKEIEKVESVKPGFINISLSKDYIIEQMNIVIAKKDTYGRSDSKIAQNVMVEYAHPNTHKLFHIGHLRNICLGESICRLLNAVGITVVRANYQGDVGMHIAKCIWAIVKDVDYQKKFKLFTKDLDAAIKYLGVSYAAGSKAYEEDETAKQEINEINAKIYADDESTAEVYKRTREWSLSYFDRIYKKLYTKFDRLYFEHEVWKRGMEIVTDGLKQGIFEKSEGAVIFPGEKFGLHNRVFINSQGLPTYEAKDMGLGELQFKEYDPDRLIHLVGPEQKGYFEVVFKALGIVDPKTMGREFHKSYGWVRLKEGKMSSRMGNVVAGEDLIEAAKEKLSGMFKITESVKKGEVLEQIAVGAVKYSMLKYAPETEFVFDIDESVSLSGNSGPYLQYTYARCQSVLQKASDKDDATGYGQMSLEPGEIAVLRKLYRYPEVVADGAAHSAPNIIANYLYDLAQAYNLFYNEYPIIKTEKEIRRFRLSLTKSVAIVIRNGLHLLGIMTPETM